MKYALIVALCCLISGLASGQAPTLSVYVEHPEWLLGEAAQVEYEVAWEGAPDAFVVAAPKFEGALPNGASAEVVSASSSVGDGKQQVTYLLEISAEAPGEYEIPPATVNYTAGTQEHTLTADGVRLQFKKPLPVGPIAWGAGLFAAMALGVALVILRNRRGRRAKAEGSSPADHAQELLHQARRLALDGNFYAYYKTLAASAAIVDKESRERLTKRAQEVGFQAVRPPDDEIQSDMRGLEKALARYKEEHANG